MSKLKAGEREGWGGGAHSCTGTFCHLIYVHAVVAGQRSGRRQVVGTEERGDDAVLVHLSDGGAVHKVYQSVLAHSDACGHRVKTKKRRRRRRDGGGGGGDKRRERIQKT